MPAPYGLERTAAARIIGAMNECLLFYFILFYFFFMTAAPLLESPGEQRKRKKKQRELLGKKPVVKEGIGEANHPISESKWTCMNHTSRASPSLGGYCSVHPYGRCLHCSPSSRAALCAALGCCAVLCCVVLRGAVAVMRALADGRWKK